MANIYDPKLNKTILKTFKNFNSKIRYNKHKTRAKGMLPTIRSAKEFMDKYSDKSRAEINKQLKLYQSFGSRKSLEKATESSRLSKWEADYFKANYAKTLEFYQKEIADLERIIGDKPEYHLKSHDRLNNLKRRAAKLTTNFSDLSEDEIKSLRSVYNYAERSDLTKKKGFRLYLSQVERTMRNLGYSKTERDALLNKFNVLSENEFLEMTRNEDLVDVFYDLIDSPKQRGKFELMTDEERARNIVAQLESQADTLIAKYKTSD